MTSRSTAAGCAGRSLLRVAAVQWGMRKFSSYDDLRSSLLSPMVEAARAGAALVAFPEGVATALAGVLLFPGKDALDTAYPAGVLAQKRSLGQDLVDAFVSLGCALAEASGVTLSLGPVCVPALKGLLRVAYLFGANGRVLGSQAQTHRTPSERAAGLGRSAELAPIDTPLGPVGLLSGVDVEYPEVGRLLSVQGARILVHHGLLHHFSEALALSRLWREVQANQTFGLEVYGVGLGYRGRSAVLAPVEITPDQTGWLARAPDDQQSAVVVADLDLTARQKLLDLYPISGLRNKAQYCRYFPQIYEANAKGEGYESA